MKIVLVLNKPIREIPIMESIKREICRINPDASVMVREFCAPGFSTFIFKFRPDVILMFPFTCEGFARWFYIYKFFLGSKIITLRAEGVVDFSFEYALDWAVGYDKYGDSLVDYELFWGGKLAKVVGPALVKQRKLSSVERARVVGYPRLEAYFEGKLKPPPTLPIRIQQKLENYKKEKIVLLITGFHLANYTAQNLFDAKDLDAENHLDELLEAVEIAKRFRSEWIANAITSATENPDALIILKKHPIERMEDYDALNAFDNILYVYEDVQVEEIIRYAGILFHYGSTTLVDAYLSKIPAVYVYSKKNKHWLSDLGWPSSIRVEEHEMAAVVKRFVAGNLNLEVNNSNIKIVLKDIFNIEENIPYRPSREIAEIILDPTVPQKIKVTDLYFLKSLASIILSPIYLRIAHRLKKTV